MPHSQRNVGAVADPAKQGGFALWRAPCLIAVSAGLAMTVSPAHAVDGCLVLLCFAAPNWRAVPQCVPPIRQVLRDLARGRPFPTCAMAGAGNGASHSWARAPDRCPTHATHSAELESGTQYFCDFDGAVSVVVQGAAYATTWWSVGGATWTEFARPPKR